MEAESQLRLEGQRNQILKDEEGRVFQAEESAWAAGARWEGVRKGTNQHEAWGPKRAGGLNRQAKLGPGDRNLLWERNALSGTFLALWSPRG